MAQRDLVVRFIGDDRDLQRAFTSSERKATVFQSRMTKLNQSLRGGIFGSGLGARGALLFGSGAFVGTATITAALSSAVTAASDFNEQSSKIEQVFGRSAKEIKDWASTTSASFGISERAALTAAGTFGNLFRTVQLAPARNAELSRSLVQLAADLASFNNASPEEVLVALRSGLIGEAEPLRRFGVLLSEARVQQQALADSGKTSVEALTNQEKVLARYKIILRDTKTAQGDFSRTSDGLANQTRILRANLDDLASNVGQILIPALTDAAEAANILFDALDKFRGVDFSPGFDFPDLPDWLTSAATVAPISPLGGVALGIKKALEDGNKEIEEAASSAADRSSSAVAIEKLDRAVSARQDQLGAVVSNLRRGQEAARRAFAILTKGLGLKLDKAGLTGGLTDDIAALRELERAILRQIEREGKTFKLVEQLTQTRLRIKALVEEQAAEAKQAGIDAFEATQDALDLNLEMAQTTKSLADDQTALRAIEQSILKRIAAEGETTDLLRRLFEVRQQQQDLARQLAEQARERRKSLQFERLGLTEEGERPTPGVGALSRRLKSLREQVKGTTLDTEKTRRELDRIAAVLSGKFGAVGKDVRAAILRMFEDIASALDEGQSGRKGPLTKTSGLNTKKILDGLGLTEEQENELRSRLSSINTAGRQLQQASRQAGTSTTGTGTPNIRGGRGGIVVENFVTVEIDGQKITATVTKQQQKQRRRNPQQKRGPNRR